jgi:hypothetical protein
MFDDFEKTPKKHCQYKSYDTNEEEGDCHVPVAIIL